WRATAARRGRIPSTPGCRDSGGPLPRGPGDCRGSGDAAVRGSPTSRAGLPAQAPTERSAGPSRRGDDVVPRDGHAVLAPASHSVERSRPVIAGPAGLEAIFNAPVNVPLIREA